MDMSGEKRRLLVCVTGMPGSGKTTVVDAIKTLGFDSVSMGNAVREEALRRGLQPSGENLAAVMFKLREELGSGAVAELCLQRVEDCRGSFVVVDGLRSMSEVEVFKRVGEVKVLAVHASPEFRFKLLQKRGRGDAPVIWEDFQARDRRELDVGVGEAVALADEVVVNSGSVVELKGRVKRVVEKWVKSFESQAFSESC